jgi:importin-7
MDTSGVASALAATLSNDAETRRAAEAALAAHADTPAHASELLRLAASCESALVAACAAVRLKNAARSARAPVPGAAAALGPDARALIRASVLPALAAATAPSAPAALAETLRWLVLLDFPARWPGLVAQIQQFLAGDAAHVSAALSALHKITKCYEFRSNEPGRLDPDDPNDVGIVHPREPLDKIVAATFPTLLDLFRRLDDSPAPGARECQKMIIKIFWCSMHFMMPPYFAGPGVLDAWLDVLITVYQRPVSPPHGSLPPSLSAASASASAADSLSGQQQQQHDLSPEMDDQDIAAMPEFKMKKWTGNVLLRFLKRYGSPKRVPADEPHTLIVATIFQDRFAAKSTAASLQVLSWPTSGGLLSGRVANIAIDFIQEAVETAALWAVIMPHIHLLLSRIIFPYLCFSDADADLWDSDPIEYVHKQTDIAEDYTSPRMAAMILLAQLGELRPKNTVLPFMTHLVSTVLEPYRAAPVGSPTRAALARQKVGAMQALSACKLRLLSKPDLGATFLDVLIVHIEPDLRSEFPFLRATANKLLGDVASSGWEPFNERLGETALRGAVSALQDPELPVQATAGSALVFLMEQDTAKPLIAPYAPQLLERLLLLMDRMSDGFVSLLPTLDKLVDRYPDELMPLAVPLMRRLVAAFKHSAAEAKADDEDCDDDLLFQAAQMLQLISSVLAYAGEWTKPSDKERSDMFAVLEQELEPVITHMFDKVNQAFAEETLEVLHTLILQTGEINHGISPFLMSMVPRLVKSFDLWASEYVSSDIVKPVMAYIAFDLDALLSMDGAVPALMTIAQRLWAEEFDDSEAVDGTKVADALILGLSRHTSRGSELANSVVIGLARAAAKRCMETTGEEGPLRVRVFGTVMLSLYYDAALVVKGLGGTAELMRLVGMVLVNVDDFTRVHDKKAVILGLSALLRAPDVDLDQSNAGFVNGILGLQERIDQQRAGDEQRDSYVDHLARLTGRGKDNGKGGGTTTNFLAARSLDTAAAGVSDAAAAAIQSGRNALLRGSDKNDESSSELADDEDASNRLLDTTDLSGMGVLEKLSAETGIEVEDLEKMNDSHFGAGNGGYIDFGDFSGNDDDEGDSPGCALDEIDEVRFFIGTIQIVVSAPWWPSVGIDARNAIDKLAQRVPST